MLFRSEMKIKKGNLNFDQSGRAYPDEPQIKENWDCIWEYEGKHYILVGDNEHKEWNEVNIYNQIVDEVYGKCDSFYFSSIKKNYKHTDEAERPTIARLTLHAYQLTINHPKSNNKIMLTAALPKDLETVLKLLRKYDI